MRPEYEVFWKGIEHEFVAPSEWADGSWLQSTKIEVSRLNGPLLSQLDLPKMESFWFTAADGVKVQGFLIPSPWL